MGSGPDHPSLLTIATHLRPSSSFSSPSSALCLWPLKLLKVLLFLFWLFFYHLINPSFLKIKSISNHTTGHRHMSFPFCTLLSSLLLLLCLHLCLFFNYTQNLLCNSWGLWLLLYTCLYPIMEQPGYNIDINLLQSKLCFWSLDNNNWAQVLVLANRQSCCVFFFSTK